MLKPQNPSAAPRGLDALEKIHRENADRVAKALERADARKRERDLELKKQPAASPNSTFKNILSWLTK